MKSRREDSPGSLQEMKWGRRILTWNICMNGFWVNCGPQWLKDLWALKLPFVGLG